MAYPGDAHLAQETAVDQQQQVQVQDGYHTPEEVLPRDMGHQQQEELFPPLQVLLEAAA